MGLGYGAPYGSRLDANRLLDRVSVDSWQRNAPNEYLVIHVHPSIIRLANRYTLSSQKVIIGLPKLVRFPSDIRWRVME